MVDAAVRSHNEWDPLVEVIVGSVRGARVPPFHSTIRATVPERHWDFFRRHAGEPFPSALVDGAERELEALCDLLKREGVRVRRPADFDYGRPTTMPGWESSNGLYSAMPRDGLLVVGEEIIETPMAWRSRYCEAHAFRPLLKDYFNRGARWSAAPKPQLTDELYDDHYDDPSRARAVSVPSVLTEHEPVFDAADFFRCGRDIFYCLSHTTNRFGVRWLTRHVGEGYRFHELDCDDLHRMHIDTTFVPLRAGLLMINPSRVRRVPEIFKSWRIVEAPPGVTPDGWPLYFSSNWLSMNVLSLDGKRVVVAEHEEPLIRALRDWGFEPLPCPFMSFYSFGGSIHCATLDVARDGALESYF